MRMVFISLTLVALSAGAAFAADAKAGAGGLRQIVQDLPRCRRNGESGDLENDEGRHGGFEIIHGSSDERRRSEEGNYGWQGKNETHRVRYGGVAGQCRGIRSQSEEVDGRRPETNIPSISVVSSVKRVKATVKAKAHASATLAH